MSRDGLTENKTEHLCMTSVDRFTKQCARTDATMGAVAEADSNVRCAGDHTGKQLPWSAVRRSREEELKYLGDLGVYVKVDVRTAIARRHASRHNVDRHRQGIRGGGTSGSGHELLHVNSGVETGQTRMQEPFDWRA